MTKLIHTVTYDTADSVESLSTSMQVAKQNGAKSLLIFLAEASLLDLHQFDQYLQATDIPIAGGIFPQIILDKNHFAQGALICSINFDVGIKTLPALNSDAPQYALKKFSPWFAKYKSFLVFVDSLSNNIDLFIDRLYDGLGADVPVAGGGAGSLTLKQKPCLLSNQGILADAAQIIGIPHKMSIGARHGWLKTAGPFLATSTRGNRIQTLNYQPAYEVYKASIEVLSEKRFTNEDFFSIAKTFPFGMEKLDQEILIRDPVSVEENTLVCVGQIPENTLLYIMRGEPKALIEASGIAANIVTDHLSDDAENIECVLFDCISRALFLEDKFEEELDSILKNLPKNSTLIGALTLGEIVSSTWGPIQFLNKTTVACRFGEEKK